MITWLPNLSRNKVALEKTQGNPRTRLAVSKKRVQKNKKTKKY